MILIFTADGGFNVYCRKENLLSFWFAFVLEITF